MSVGFVLLVAVQLVLLHAPDGTDIVVNPQEVVSMRGPRAEVKEGEKHFAEGVNCMINTSDGKFLSVRETCADVMRMFVNTERQP